MVGGAEEKKEPEHKYEVYDGKLYFTVNWSSYLYYFFSKVSNEMKVGA